MFDKVSLYPIQIPWQWIIGSANPFRHKLFFAAASEAIHARIPNSELAILPSAAHLSNIEQSELFNSILLRFLNNL